jgi:ADP-ribose pyrophosphatase
MQDAHGDAVSRAVLMRKIAARVASLPPWDNLGEIVRYSNDAVKLIGKIAKSRKTGLQREFTVLKYPDWVHVAALTPDGRLVLVRQFRHGIDRFTIELPGGAVEEGETPEQAGRRELSEEASFASRDWEPLGSMCANPATNANLVHAFFAREATPTEGLDPDMDEELEIFPCPVKEVVSMCLDGRIVHPFTHSTVFKLISIHPELL